MKKLLALVLVLAMMVPALGLAEAKPMIGDAYENGKMVEFSFCALIDEALVGAQASEMISEFTLAVTAQKDPDQMGMALYYGEDVVADLELEAREGEVCVRSNLLGDKAILIKADDVEALAARVAKYAVDNDLMTQADADSLLAELSAEIQSAEAPVEAVPEVEPVLTEEQQQQLIDALTSIDISAAMDEILVLASKVEIITENVPQHGTDEAAMLIQGSYTGEDAALLVQALVKSLRSSDGLVAMLAEGGLDISSPSFESAMNAVLEEVAGAVKSLDFGVYLDADGKVVYFSSTPVFAEEGNEITGSISYKRNTLEDSLLYTLELGAGAQPAEGEYAELFNAQLTYQVRADGGRIVFTMGDMELTATTYTTTQPLEGGEFSEWLLSGEMLVSGESVGTAKLQTGTFISGPQEELPSIVTSISLCLNDDVPVVTLLANAETLAEKSAAFDGAVDPMAMTDEAFSAFMDGLLSSVAAWMTNVDAIFPAAAE